VSIWAIRPPSRSWRFHRRIRNRGHGTALVEAAEQRAGELGHPRVCLGVGVDNPDARRLFERLGYREWEHGLVTVAWEDEGGPDSLTGHRLVKRLPGH
jgi:RimJ/RimL family protein N-acetyltransferase